MEQEKYIDHFLAISSEIITKLDRRQIITVSRLLAQIRDSEGRLFILGVGGSAGNASHAVNDFRKIAGIECYTPTDNVSELTARINDEGWDTVFSSWLVGSNLTKNDGILVFSVGGGNIEKKISVNLVRALEYAKSIGVKIIGIVGRDGGYTAEVADGCVIIPPLDEAAITPQTEAFQAVIWHLLVSSPDLQKYRMKWETVR
ncbi:MAG TPA: SIS domain-containing protein [Methanoregulaceae archaeon]|nr:SIS domain-containing protein [Methanoregulaceae archaeon]HQN89633.1 SIS domain-containing protein [Methanoregulaceae archaeon]HQP81877.1 SIS domain-containing protein [Methanoregulaceae archaeon]